jgi:hypothetical protein
VPAMATPYVPAGLRRCASRSDWPAERPHLPLWANVSRLSGRPRLTVATEAWPPNVAAVLGCARRGSRSSEMRVPRETERSRPLGRALDLGCGQ